MAFKFILLVNLTLGLAIVFFLDIPAIIISLTLLLVFNLCIYFIHPVKLIQRFNPTHFSPKDPWQLTTMIHNLQTQFGVQKLSFYKTQKDLPYSICFGTPSQSYIIFSESLLDTFSKKELKLLVTYYLYMISNGGTFVLTFLSGVLYGVNLLLTFVTYPFKRFQKKKSINWFMIFTCSVLSWWTKRLFLKSDVSFIKTEKEKKQWALFVWKIDSLYKLERRDIFIDTAPLCLTNPLTNIKWECYMSLHPQIRLRVKNLIHSYPP